MEPVSQLTGAQIVILAIFAGGVATAIGAVWYFTVDRGSPNALWRRIERLEARVNAQDREIDALREEKLADRAQIAAMKMELDDLYDGVKMLTEQIEAAGLVPVWKAHRRAPSARIAAHITLAGQVAEQFSVDEIDNLAFDIGIEPEDIGGATRNERARQLVDMARRHGKLQDLERRMAELRPR
jgi:uncharacterized coiled-coil protein SlyX